MTNGENHDLRPRRSRLGGVAQGMLQRKAYAGTDALFTLSSLIVARVLALCPFRRVLALSSAKRLANLMARRRRVSLRLSSLWPISVHPRRVTAKCSDWVGHPSDRSSIYLEGDIRMISHHDGRAQRRRIRWTLRRHKHSSASFPVFAGRMSGDDALNRSLRSILLC